MSFYFFAFMILLIEVKYKPKCLDGIQEVLAVCVILEDGLLLECKYFSP